MSADAKPLEEQIAAEADATADQPMPAGTVGTKPNKSMPAGTVGTKPNKSMPVAVRLAPEDVAAIEALAGQLDVPMSTLLRGWILTALKSTREESVTTALDRISADVQRLRELVT